MLSKLETTTSITTTLSPLTADRLYRIAERLAYEWRDSGLDDDFDSAMIIAVIRFLEKTGTRRVDGTRRSPQEQAEFAEALLRRFWAMNAKRDAARRTAERDRGTHPDVLPLDLVGESAETVRLHDPLRDDLLAGETGRTVARYLEELGWPRERAWAFVWRESGREWDDVAFLLADRFEIDAKPGQLRKWGERYFEPVKPRVQTFLENQSREDDLPTAEPVSHGERMVTISNMATL